MDAVRQPILNAFTVDLEDYFQVSAFERRVSRDRWHRYPSRIVPNTQRLLDLLERHETRATFFALGWIADRFPALLRAIARGGHEVACHSYWHRLAYRLTPDEFRRDLRQAREAIEQAVGERVLSFRAPSWSITRQSLWALDILAEEGFRYDSSIFPVFHDRYGIPGANPHPHVIRTGAGPLGEFPGSVVRRFGVNIPVSGGGYFRLYPAAWTIGWLRRINEQARQPFMFYVHPWELDPNQPRLFGRWRKWRHYVNLGTTRAKLERLLLEFRFGRMDEVLEVYFAAASGTPPPLTLEASNVSA
jgi:polysaccharide deacetylase family protein (PEP-CTERM system associated)